MTKREREARIGRWGLGRSAMGLGVGRRNMSMMRKLASELKRKKKLRKKKKRRETKERERK